MIETIETSYGCKKIEQDHDVQVCLMGGAICKNQV
jgi:hypothetical protein